MIRIKTQNVLNNLGNIFKMNTFFDSIYLQELYLEPNQKSMMELFCKNT